MRIALPDPLTWESGIEFGLQAIGELVRQGIPIEFSLLDHGAMLEAATFGIIQYQLHPNVRWVRRWPGSFAAFDVAIFPRVAAMETATISQILDQGLPVVSSDPVFVVSTNFQQFPRRDWQALANILRNRLNVAGQAAS